MLDPTPTQPQKKSKPRKKILFSLGLMLLSGIGGALTSTKFADWGKNFFHKIAQAYFVDSLTELAHVDNVSKINLLPVMTADELPEGQKDFLPEVRKKIDDSAQRKCTAERIVRFDQKLGVSPRARKIYEIPENLAISKDSPCDTYQILAFARRPFVFSGYFLDGRTWIDWARHKGTAKKL